MGRARSTQKPLRTAAPAALMRRAISKIGNHNQPLNEFERARRHSQRVRILKFALPGFGLIALLAVIGSFFFTGPDLASIGVGGLRFEQGQLVMDKPKLTGLDDSDRPYALFAERAIQDAEQPSRISLEGIRAELPLSDSEQAQIMAGDGLYDADAKTLNLGGTIRAETSNGMTLKMSDAMIDIETGLMRSNNPVSVDTGRMQVVANAIRVENNGENIVFFDGVRVKILPFEEEASAISKEPLE